MSESRNIPDAELKVLNARPMRQPAVVVGREDQPQRKGEPRRTAFTVRADGQDFAVLYTHDDQWTVRDAWCRTCRSEVCSHALHLLALGSEGSIH